MHGAGEHGPRPGACLLPQPELRAGSPGSPPLPTTEPSNACAFPALDSAGATGPELEKSLIQFTTGARAAQRPRVLVKAPEHLLPQNSVSSMPSDQDGSAESSVPTKGNLNQREDSVDIPTEAPAATRALQSLADFSGPQAVAGEGAQAPEWSPEPAPPDPQRRPSSPRTWNWQDGCESGS
ncbi:translation initiation factor IF-2-like [Oryx dammah]|uniref:translation initiation factor IF-2-like n=1 Tax=Oryx dammah TaxID=59534 RepID=UPI001A9AA06E|nr:translation initiation factor IF-2-like [Oryx dammah]